MEIETVAIGSLRLDSSNARKHDGRNLKTIEDSLKRFGQRKPIVVSTDGVVIAGNGTLQAAIALGWTDISVARVPSDWTADQIKAYALVDNRSAELAEWDADILATQLIELDDMGWDIAELGFDIPEENQPESEPAPKLADRFVIVPLSVFDQRSADWQQRKKRWLSIGLRSEVGRAETLTLASKSGSVPDYYSQKDAAEKKIGRALDNAEFERDYLVISETAGLSSTGTSVFDPVLCEIAYRWFSPADGLVLDPFAGGVVRGAIAALLGRSYVGIDLRPEQVQANQAQWEQISSAQKKPRATPEVSSHTELTPVELVDGIYYKRDDSLNIDGSRGGKIRGCISIIEKALESGPISGLITAGSRQSPQVNIVATLAMKYGVPCRVHVPSGALTPELLAAEALGAEIVQHTAGYNNVIIARAREDAASSGWLEIPFGMEHSIAVEATSRQVANLPKDIRRIVVPVGSGMTLAGILHGLIKNNITVPVLGIQVGAEIEKRLDKYAPSSWRSMVTIIKSQLDYHTEAPVTSISGIGLDPIYEAKTLAYLEKGDLLWIVGKRATADYEIGSATWITGDSLDIATLAPVEADLVFSCPPYADLEVYSDDPADISNMPYEKFLEIYTEIIKRSVAQLKNDSFAVWVVGDVRDKKGIYRGLVPDTIQAFEEAGAQYYNEAILVSPVGSLAIRVAKFFTTSRKLGKTHQTVLIFVKGDPKKATQRCGAIEVTLPVEDSDHEE